MIYTSGDWMVKPGREEESSSRPGTTLRSGRPPRLLQERPPRCCATAMNLPTFGALDHGTAMSRSLRGGKARVSWRGLGGFANFLTDSRPTPWMWSLTWAARCREP